MIGDKLALSGRTAGGIDAQKDCFQSEGYMIWLLCKSSVKFILVYFFGLKAFSMFFRRDCSFNFLLRKLAFPISDWIVPIM